MMMHASKGIHYRHHQKSKTGVPVAPQKGLMSSNFFSKRRQNCAYLPRKHAGRRGPSWCPPDIRTSPRRLSLSHSGDRPTRTSCCTGPGRKQCANLQPEVSLNKPILTGEDALCSWILNTSVRGKASLLILNSSDSYLAVFEFEFPTCV